MSDITIPAHLLLLDGWCGPALMHEAGSSTGVAVLGPDERPEAERSGPWTAMAASGEWPWPCWSGTEHMVRSVTTEALTLDLRRPEVQDRVSRAMWGASGAVVKKYWDAPSNSYGWCLQVGMVVVATSGHGWPCLANTGRRPDSFTPGLAILAELPETDRLPAALRLCWMRWLEVRGE
jgi:hypothetical protein